MIYCVEDDAGIRNMVVYTLRSTGFEAEGLADGAAFFEAMKKTRPQLVLLDIMLPGDDGLTILKKLRNNPATAELPVILATAKGSEYDKVTGLDLGADDYLAKPFGMMEMVSRVKAVLRRTTPRQDQQVLQAGALSLNLGEHIVTVDGQRVTLTLKEFEVLRAMMEHVGQVFTRDRLLGEIWGYDFDGETRTVDVHMRTLRQKLGRCGDYIETVRGVGYRLEVEHP
ncbi:winged helix-turn-helix domain-containing protein [Candidatus Avoscillospira sp. LCP25S3_F1]|uniref:winged helix-turn-helix domain-containing protein n=1 Tax=Candidatus Avoscillospira sp. LCP25S3_F1 TaxID=3438825 RepID=UPI003F919C78